MILLTGGAGFIGCNVLQELNETGRSDILVVDNLGDSEKWRNLQGKRFLDYIHKYELESMLEQAANHSVGRPPMKSNHAFARSKSPAILGLLRMNCGGNG